MKAPTGAVVVFGLDGKIRQTVAGLDRPNNVDVEYGLALGGQPVDIAVATERLKSQLRVFRIAPDGSGISDVTSPQHTRIRRPRRRAGRSHGHLALPASPRRRHLRDRRSEERPAEGYLGQYRLEDDGRGRVKATFVRYFGRFSGTARSKPSPVDDALGYVYYADEGNGIHKYHADPDHRDAADELAHFGRTGFNADREGIAIYAARTAPATSSAPTRSPATATITSSGAKASQAARTITPLS